MSFDNHQVVQVPSLLGESTFQKQFSVLLVGTGACISKKYMPSITEKFLIPSERLSILWFFNILAKEGRNRIKLSLIENHLKQLNSPLVNLISHNSFGRNIIPLLQDQNILNIDEISL